MSGHRDDGVFGATTQARVIALPRAHGGFLDR
jgi:hypothetical protein